MDAGTRVSDQHSVRISETQGESVDSQISAVYTSLSISLSALLRFLIAALAVSLIVEGALPQLEMALFHGNIPIPENYGGYLLLLLFGIAVITNTKFTRDSLAGAAFFLVAFLLLDAVHLVFNEGVAPIELVHSYFGFYFPLLIGAFASAIRIRVNERLLVFLIIVVFIVSIVISAIQATTNSPVLPTQSNDQTWAVNADTFLGGESQRAFGLFESGLGMGLFCSFMGALGASYCRTLKGALLGIPLLLASAYGCYVTLTRIAILDLICCILTVYVLSKRRWRLQGKWLPILWALVALATVLQAATGAGNRSHTLANTDSVTLRIQGWEVSLATFASAPPLEKALGLGIAPGNAYVSSAVQPTKHLPIPIDNISIVILLYVGILGLLITVVFFVKSWLYILRRALSGGSHLQTAVAAFWSTVLLAGSFNVTLGPLGALLLVSALCEPGNSSKVLRSFAGKPGSEITAA
jgi:hypothetical protein